MERARIGAFLAAAAALLLSLVFASQTPYLKPGVGIGSRAAQIDMGAPDELQHVNRVAMVARGEGFGKLAPDMPAADRNYQVHQPPLYYTLGAVWMKATGGASPSLDQSGEGSRLRGLNALIVAGTVLSIFALASAAGGSPAAALVAAWGAALLPMHVALGGAVSNDPLLYLLSTLALTALCRAVRGGWTVSLAAQAGLWTGLAVLTKTNGLALLAPFLAAAFLAPARPTWKAVFVGAGLVALLTVPWFVRNVIVYGGDPLVLKAFERSFTGQENAVALGNAFGPFGYWIGMVVWWTARSSVGVFGYMDIWMTNDGQPRGASGLYILGLAIPLVGLVGWAMGLSSAERADKRAQVLLLGYSLVVVALFLRFNMTYFQAQGRYLFPALGAVGTLVGIGLTRLLAKRPGSALLLACLVYGGLDVYALSKLPAEFAKRTPPEVGGR